MHKRILLFILTSISAGHALAQQSLSVAPGIVSTSSTDLGKSYYANRNEPPRAIEFKERTVTTADFLTNINHYFTIPDEFTFIEEESNTDNLGMQHRYLHQYYEGIPIEGMGYKVHEKDGFVRSANGKAVRDLTLETQTALTEEQAFHLAVNYLHTKDTTVRRGTKLIVSKNFTYTPESFSIAFQFDIDVSLAERWRVSIDTRNGQLINKVSLVNTCFNEIEPPLPYGTGTGKSSYYGKRTIRVDKLGDGSRLIGQTEHGGNIGTYDFGNGPIIILELGIPFIVPVFYSPDNTYNNAYQKPAVSVQWGAEQAYEYYFKKHQRNSYDNNGATIKSYVHVGENFDNALWNGSLFIFGDGANNNPLVELDIVGHELTHAVTQNEANLAYVGEFGALNESFSDIFGKAIEFDTFGDTATWQLGRRYRAGGLRNMSNPNLKNQPDTYAGNMWYTGSADSGGVHTNSGVQNFWFYLLCEGGNGINDHQVNYTVNAIGMEKAVNISYRNLTEYLDVYSDYLDSRIGSLLAAGDLYGSGSAVYQEVDKAWDAVGVIDKPIITGIEIYDITATTVKIKGSMLPRADVATYHFEYGITQAFGSSSPLYPYTDAVEGILTGLQSETKYYARIVATNANGSSYATANFTTISLTPLVKLKQTVDVTETTATLYGQINPNSLPTSFYFEYGQTPSFGLVTPSYPMSAGTEFLNVSAALTNLQPRKKYYYRLVAINNFATSATESATFFTAQKPIIDSYSPATAPIDTEVTIKGQNFNATPENNIVSFGATRALVVSSTSTELKVKVPKGASLGPISLLDAESGLMTESVREFVPTFTSEFKKGALKLTAGTNDVYPYQTLVTDMDGDYRPDIVVRHYQGFSIFQNVNQGGDLTNESFIRNTYSTTEFADDISLIDFDGNGLKDIVGEYQNGLRIYPNLSVAGYIFFGAPVDLPISNVRNAAFADFDMDGHIDIATTRNLSGIITLTILRNQNPKGFLLANNFVQQYSLALPYEAYNLNVDDLNNDGKPDLLARAINISFVPMLKNNGYPGTFAFEQITAEDLTRGRDVRLVSQDLNQDGWKDIVCHSHSQVGTLAILENERTSSAITLKKPIVELSGYTESAVQAGDIDGDGRVDLLVGVNNEKFMLLKNNTVNGNQISNSSFEKFDEYGIVNTTNSTQNGMAINDLNGDGKPDVINTHSYNGSFYVGYRIEIWQNSPSCPEPPVITVNVLSTYKATVVLPPNTTANQFEIEYQIKGSGNWTIGSTTLDLYAGTTYQARARAKCHIYYFGDYYYTDFFTTDCRDSRDFSVADIDVSAIKLNRYNFEVQYSAAGKNEWITVPQNISQILNLSPNTTYDLRFRGVCTTPAGFIYKQFTTLCTKLSTVIIDELVYDKAVVRLTAGYTDYTSDAVLEYSTDNTSWKSIDKTRTITPLVIGKQYFVRARMVCENSNSDYIYTSFTAPCPQVSMLNIEAVTPFSARINWVDKSATNNYTLRYSTMGNSSAQSVQTNLTSFTLPGLNPGTTYTVAVAPKCIIAQDFVETTFNTVCYMPSNLSVNDITTTTAKLSWSDRFGGYPYFIDYSISGSNVWQTTETQTTNVSLSDLRPGTAYQVKVHINCTSERPPYASLIFETNLYEATTFAPNPTHSETTIYPSKSLIGHSYSIRDNTGRSVAEGVMLSYTIDLSNFSAGIYMLKIDGEKPMKIVKK